MQVRWFRSAVEDLVELRHYIANDKPTAAQAVAKRILRETEKLRSHPGMGRPGRVEGTRELVIPGLPYIIAYRVKNNTVELLRVLHAARVWPKEL